MWNLILTINSVLLALASTYFVYSIGASIVLGNGKIFVVGLIIWLIFVIAEIVIAGINES